MLFSRRHVACLLLQTLELDPGNTVSMAKTARLEPVVAERREKMKDEMIGAAACFATCKPECIPGPIVRLVACCWLPSAAGHAEDRVCDCAAMVCWQCATLHNCDEEN